MAGLDPLKRLVEKLIEKREQDKEKFNNRDTDLCMLCHAYGADKRALWISCTYDVAEFIPEALDVTNMEGTPFASTSSGWYLNICKSCRGSLLELLGQWRKMCISLRDRPKDHDGYLEEDTKDINKNIPVRVAGRIVWMDEEEYYRFKGVV